jgi:hypothetical protein
MSLVYESSHRPMDAYSEDLRLKIVHPLPLSGVDEAHSSAPKAAPPRPLALFVGSVSSVPLAQSGPFSYS